MWQFGQFAEVFIFLDLFLRAISFGGNKINYYPFVSISDWQTVAYGLNLTLYR